jgi:hypothetical protein
MRTRRGEVPFVAIRVGRSMDPLEVLGPARELKISRALALGYLALWEEMILELGDAINGRLPKKYGAAQIAAKLDFPGRPRAIVEALRRAGVLGTYKGVFMHAYWRQSVTGQYASERAEQREHWRQKKADQRAGDVSESLRDNGGTSLGTADIKKESNGVNGAPPPPAPPQAGGSLGASRWKWVEENHKRPANSQACIKLLGTLSADHWALFQWSVGLPARGGPLSMSRKKRVLGLDSHRFLLSEAYLQLLPEWRAKLAHDAAPPKARPPAAAAAADAELARLKASEKYVLAHLADPELTDDKRSNIKTKWAHAHPHVIPPWEDIAHQSGGAEA